MRARLYSAANEMQVDHTFEQEAVLGRSSKATLELRSKVLSARHARIAWNKERGCYILEDLGSSNGTRLDGDPVHEPRALGHLHVITLAEHHDLVFQDLERCASRHRVVAVGGPPTTHTAIEVLNLPLPGLLEVDQTPEREKTLLQKLNLPLPGLLRGRDEPDPPHGAVEEITAPDPPTPVPETHHLADDPATEPGRVPARREDEADKAPIEVVTKGEPEPASTRPARWSIEIIDPGVTVPRFRLFGGDNVVGRKTGADIVIRSPEISRRHACLTVREGRLFVRDLGSRNRTFVDDVPVDEETELGPGQKLRFGALETRVVVGGFSDEGRSLDQGGGE